MEAILKLLESKGVKPTSNRILVVKALAKAINPVSLSDVDTIIKTMDRSSIFRALTLFVERGIAHSFEDGSGSMKYELCDGRGHCSPADMHIHFYCEGCDSTFCLPSTPVPEVELPDGYVARYVNYTVKGYCPKCSMKMGY